MGQTRFPNSSISAGEGFIFNENEALAGITDKIRFVTDIKKTGNRLKIMSKDVTISGGIITDISEGIIEFIDL